MAARRLQAEIDRTLKRVREGVDEFEAVHDKLQNAVSNAQKEKMEGDLKTMIKKLQRLRDQIKTWLQSNEVKDKSQLLEYRSLIETQMETFKAVEKEMKTKAFSKEGLSAAVKKDPAEEAKDEAKEWLSSQMSRLGIQIEVDEAEIEQLTAPKKGRKGSIVAKEGRLAALKGLNSSRLWHISRLELLLRLVQNDTVLPEELDSIKEDVSFFVHNNTEEGLTFADYDYIYDDFNLDEEEEAFGLKETGDMTSSHDTTSTAPPDESHGAKPSKRRESVDDSALESPKDKRGAKRKEHVKEKDRERERDASVAKPVSTKDGEDDKTVVPTANFSKLASQGPAVSPTKPSAAGTVTMPPIRYAAAAAAAMSGSAVHPASGGDDSVSLASSAKTSLSPTMVHHSRAASLVQSHNPPFLQPSPPASHESAGSSSDPASAAPAAASTAAPPDTTGPESASVPATVSPPAGSTLSVGSGLSTVTNTAAATPTPTMLNLAQHPSTLTSKPESSSSSVAAPAPHPLVALMPSFDTEALRQASLLGDGSPEHMERVAGALNGSAENMPDAQDSERPKYYVPKTPYPTPAYYPQEPLAVFDSPGLYRRLDLDTLFFIFYYQQGTYHQYLAARELKHQSWRFHKQYLTWFQRHTEPVEITNEYELGTYIYFDWEGSWLQRKKSDFRFEYRWLED